MKRIGLMMAAAVITCACSMEGFDADKYVSGAFSGIVGQVTYENGQPIEHIMVTLDGSENEVPALVYTDSDGVFMSTMDFNPDTMKDHILTVTLEDIDGEEHGGLFESFSDIVRFEEEEVKTPVRVTLSYTLLHATASENIPQS